MSATTESPEEVDVLISGAGPVGLLIAYCLARYGVSTHVVEQHERAQQTRYGRAAMIAPRTLEMLDQLDLADQLGQIGFVVRGQSSYKNGEKVESVSSAASDITDTFFDYLLLCRQRYTEDVIREGYSRFSDGAVQYGARLTGFSVMTGSNERFQVHCIIENQNGIKATVKSKHLIGADGGRSTVREIAGIEFEGESSSRFWVRIDGIVETDMPEARRGICGIESSSHGSVLWACLDHGVTRVGFALPRELRERLGANISKDDVILEAQKALRPFTLEFKTVDWWTVYSVGQRLASQYISNGGRVMLAGDAAHTHSSGAAQGMNTGLHDAVNLSWKLAGHIKGWFAGSVLDSYTAERRPIAHKIIEQDKIISVLTGGEIPEAFKSDPNVDPHKLLTDTYKKNASLNTGLGVTYPPDSLTIVHSKSQKEYKVLPGERGPDALLQRPGTHIPIRLLSLLKNYGRFTAILFCGDPSNNSNSIKKRRLYLNDRGSFKEYPETLCSQMTIIASANDAGSPAERLGSDFYGPTFYDVDGSAHARFGVSLEKGAVFLLRPDGTVGTAFDVEDGAAASKYFGQFVIEAGENRLHDQKPEDCDENFPAKGEIDIDGEVRPKN